MVLGSLEHEVMRALWSSATPLSVREVLTQVNKGRAEQLAYTTVMTVLSRLAEKDVLWRSRKGRGFVYRPAVADEAEVAVREVLRRFGGAAVSHFVAAASADPDTKERLRRLLEEER